MTPILSKLSKRFLSKKSLSFKRFLFNEIDFKAPIIGIKGGRGSGKTTLLHQYAKTTKYKPSKILYISCDHPAMIGEQLYKIADEFYAYGGKLLILDEIHKIKSFALEKDNYISISMDIQPKSSKSAKKSLQPTPVESSVSEMPQDVDVNDLFSDVWTKKIQKKKIQPKDSKRIKDIQKKIKTTQANSVESISEKFNELDNSKLNEENSPSSTANEVNEYLAKIQALVYRYFSVPPNSEGHSVMAYIELNSIGKVMDFRILNYSANDALNAEVDKIKDRLKSVVFPINPQNRSFSTKVILKSKE